jgi:hypothetical protein
VTTDETESLARAAALGQQEDAQNRHWQLCARVARIATVVLGLLTMASAVGSMFAHRTDLLDAIFDFMMMAALLLNLSFTRAAGPIQRQSA